MSMPIIDFVFLVIIIAFGVIGVLKGFINGVFSLAAPVLGLWGAAVFFEKLASPLETYVQIHWLSLVLAFLLIFIVIFLVLKIIEKVLKGIFGGSIFRSLDRVLGLVFGLLEGAAVVTVIIVVLKAQPWFPVDSLLEGSWFYRIVSPMIATPVNELSGAVDKAAAAGSEAIKAVGK